MENENNLKLFYPRVRGKVNWKPDILIKEQSSSKLRFNPHRLKKELIKKIRKPAVVDSSYYLG